MLIHLHVKNLALIRESEADFTDGLNILTGETGAGKSILIGSVGLALGGKASKDLVSRGADYGLVELIFQVRRESQLRALRELGVVPEDDEIIISRKISGSRSINKINGETVPLSMLKSVTSVLLDMHGQHEYQSLLNKKKHLEILDEYAVEELASSKEELAKQYHLYKKLIRELEEAEVDPKERLREASLLEYEINEIEAASPAPGEDDGLEKLYQKMSNAIALKEAAGSAYSLTGYDDGAGGTLIGRALREMQGAAAYDEGARGLLGQLDDIDGLLNDFNRELSDYLSSLDFDEETFAQTEERLDLINSLKAKYGRSIEEVLEYCDGRKKRLKALSDYDTYLEDLRSKIRDAGERLDSICASVSAVRRKSAGSFCDDIRGHLEDLNFADCRFEVEFRETADYTADGRDDVEFMISTNPGEPLRPLSKVASGGELSRVMLAIKTVLADKDDVDTVIFDEIDAGISGRAAQKVAEKLMLISHTRQVVCITHLAQIAAMADSHFLIEKSSDEKGTSTTVVRLSEQESVEELARMLGGARITEAVLGNAAEMKQLADKWKSGG